MKGIPIILHFCIFYLLMYLGTYHDHATNIIDGFEKVRFLRCAASFVTAT